jgi:diguanylate cyclase (GGDEF)-like protein
MDAVAKLLLDYLRNVVYDPEHAVLDLQKLPEGFQDFGKGLLYFSECVLETAALAKAISKGDLDVKLPSQDNEMATPLKALHAALKHLTWQTQQVAKGDYQQRVDFMGDFSDAFNAMTEQLEQQRLILLKEIHTMVQNKNLYELLVGQIAQWIIVTDADTSEWLFVSREIDGALAGARCELQLRQWLSRQTEAMKGKSEVCTTELELSDDAGIHYYSVSSHPLHWNQHNALAFVLTDVSRERERLNKLQNIANSDTLTQLYNRRYGMEVLNEWLAEGRSFILCFVDIDNLKYVNDRFGHSKGDQYIVCVSNTMREFSPDAVICRIGGDEFMLLAENWSPDAAKERLEVLRNQLTGCNGNPDTSYDHSISYGVIQVGPDNTLLANDLLSAADEKMYEYKRAYKIRLKNKPM